MKNYALVIGINQYTAGFKSLNYALNDADAMVNYFRNKAKFDEIFYFSDKSPDIIAPNGSTWRTIPTFGHLLSFLNNRFADDATPFLESEDNFWFFFSGHGMRHENKDYLIPSDANPLDIRHTAISVEYVVECLRRSGTDNIILLLDACRNSNDNHAMDIGIEAHQEVITIYSCSTQEKSYEIKEIEQGSFTYALLKALSIQGKNNCATVERLARELQNQISRINEEYKKPLQTPCVRTERKSRKNFILLPKQATVNDLILFKNYAWRAESEYDWEFAYQLWTRINIAAGGKDEDAEKAITRLLPKRPLASERRIDYTRLHDLLEARKWQEADEETAKRMLEVMNRKYFKFLRGEDMENFPCKDLHTINQLWIKYSNGHFGFSVQSRILNELSGSGDGSGDDYNTQIWEEFGDLIGWRKKGKWLKYQDITFDSNAPPGHLPVGGAGLRRLTAQNIHLGFFVKRFSALVKKLTVCKIS